MTDSPALDAALGSLDTLQQGLRAGRWSPTEVVEAVVARRHRGQAAAWIDHVPAADLRARAADLEREGPGDRPLWGVPVAVKGNLDVAGLPTTAACPGFAAGPAARHAAAVARLVDAGAVPVGTTNLDQFATGLVGTRSPYGVPHAAGHPGWIAGGSSSGSAVAVAEGVVPVAIATDTAGSGRVPAALNGIAALKPTRGRISTAGVVPACRSLDCVATFAATPAEAGRVADLMAGLDPADPWSRPPPDRWVSDTGGAGRRPRVGVAAAGADRRLGDDAVAAAAHAAAEDAARSLGWEVVEVDVGPFLAGGELLYGGAFVAERFASVGPAVRAGVAGLDPVVAGIVGDAADIPAWRAFADIDRIRALRAETVPVWAAVDAVLLPVVPTTIRIADVAADPRGTNTMLGTYTSFANLFDLCVAVAPVAPRSDGHPWGVQLLAPAWRDAAVAHLAHELWAATVGAARVRVPEGMVGLVVAGAHLRGQALDHQVVECGGLWLATTRTARRYALRLVADDPPRPGLEDAGPARGASIEVDVWALPPHGWARFVAAGVPGLAVGRVALAGGVVLPGFVAAAGSTEGSADLTPFGGWRAWRAWRAAGSP